MRRLLPVAALALAAGAAHADDEMLYVGAGILRDNVSDIATINSSLNATSWKAFVGFRPVSLFAVEADYLDLGSETESFLGSSVHLQYKAFGAYAVGFAPIPVPYLDVFGKVGLARWSVSGSTSLPPGSLFSLSDNGTDFAWGVGGQVHIGNVGGRLEYEDFHIRNTSGAGIFSLSVYVNLL